MLDRHRLPPSWLPFRKAQARSAAVGAPSRTIWRISLAVPETELQWRPGLLMHGLQRLPVSFEIDERQPPANFITPHAGS